MPYPVFDTHVDLLHHLIKTAPETPFPQLGAGILTSDTLRRGNVRIFGSAYYCPDKYNGPGTALDYLQDVLLFAQRTTASLPPVRTREELQVLWRDPESGPGTLFLLENCDALLEWGVEACVQAGFSILGLTHIGRNRLGDGNGVDNPEGLTREGRRIVREAEEAGLVLDVAHLSPPAFEDMLEVSSTSLISSHTGFAHFHATPRNLKTEQIRLIVERGGVIGIAAAPGMLAAEGKVTLNDLEIQIDWFVQQFGPSHLGMGTDFGGFRGTVQGMESPARLQELAHSLEKRGYGQEEVAGIMGENWFAFFSQHLPETQD